MKKICFITTTSLTLDMFVLDTARYIHEKKDWDITFVCNQDDIFASRLPEYIHYYPIAMERGINLGGFKAILQMKKFFIEQKFDLIQYSTPNASLYAALAGKLAKIPIRLYCQWGMAFVGFTGVKRRVFKAIEKTVCRLSTWIEPDSISNLKFSHKEGLYPVNMGSVIWNGSACGVNLKKFDVSNKTKYRADVRNKLNIPDDAFVFGFVGRVTRDKGINELFEAAKEILTKRKNVYLLIVGPEEVDKKINIDLHNWSKATPNVIYVSFTRVVEQYMSAMDCYVQPSYREGFGMSVVEAEAMSVPVIITNIPGPIDGMRVGITGEVVEPKDAKALQECMIKMLDSDLTLYGQNALKFVQISFEQQQMLNFILQDRIRLLNE